MKKYMFLFCSLVFFMGCKQEASNVISKVQEDLDGDGYLERVYYYHKGGHADSVYLSIERMNQSSKKWETYFNQMVDNENYGKVLGFLVMDKKHKAVVVTTSPQGSGGFGGYKVISNYTVIYEREGVYQGSFSLDSNKIIEIEGDPLPSDPNCCPSYFKKSYVELKESADFREGWGVGNVRTVRVKADSVRVM